jgi:PRTRC genetic system protein E
MQTNFFQTIQDLNVTGDWKITIGKDSTGTLIVSVLFFNHQSGDEAAKLIPPMLLKGTPAELDNGFFAAINEPVQKASALFANMAQYNQSIETAKGKSKMEQGQQDKEKKEKENRKKQYEEKMKRVAELEEKKKIGEAIGAMPKAEEYHEQAETIQKKLDELWQQHQQLSMF